MRIEYEVLVDVGAEMADIELTTEDKAEALECMVMMAEEGWTVWVNVYEDEEYKETLDFDTFKAYAESLWEGGWTVHDTVEDVMAQTELGRMASWKVLAYIGVLMDRYSA